MPKLKKKKTKRQCEYFKNFKEGMQIFKKKSTATSSQAMLDYSRVIRSKLAQ